MSATTAADLQGALRLTRDATLGLTDLVEALHQQILRPLAAAPAADAPPRRGGLTGLVYGGVRGVTRGVGDAADGLLAAVAQRLPPPGPRPPSPEREALIAVLGGVLGDHLAASANPLAVTMALRSQGRALRLQPASLAATLRPAGARLLVLVHGLCMNDLRWQRDGHDHGAALARDLGLTPVYLHYNSGRAIADNGRDFAALMTQLLAHWPVPVTELNLLAHSMGGLVARSAIAQARTAGQTWARRVDRLVCLGTPHHGAPLERGGQWVHALLDANRYSAPFARLARLRSAGITDLRHGHVLPGDGGDGDRFARGPDRRAVLALPEGVACYAVAGSTGAHAADLGSRLLGDGLVPLASALGRHDDPRRTLAFAPERQWVAQGVHHMQLLGDAGVYRQLRAWLAAPSRDR